MADGTLTRTAVRRWPRAAGRGRRGEELTKILFVLPAAVAMVALFGYPVVKNLLMSLQDYGLRTFFTGEAPFVGLANYTAMVKDQLFSQAMVNTGLFTIGSIAFQFAIGLGLALFFRRRFPLSGFLRSMLLLPWLLPLIVSSATWRSILEQDNGILNRTLIGAGLLDDPVPWLNSPSVALIAVIGVNVWIGIPFNVTLLYSGLTEIPDELYEAGQLDGATGWSAFVHITWPNLRAVASVVLMLGVVYTIKVLDIILGLTGGGPANATQTLATQSYERSFVDFKFGEGAALSNLLIALSFLFAIFYLRGTRRAVDE
ncbi:carbohydrate ABC transporter permease [Kribbella italica]|uniref:Multiple sugar transport system permease protein n=1 Tax=Kribbella italica TaxID=1540520 RepID=A0A7W9MVP7_9ACTN|nr:sugar ABC transporter permease [Kribbella italica]MBB5838126.1 multiple sugar transport system permease protein [Kribbella italica]